MSEEEFLGFLVRVHEYRGYIESHQTIVHGGNGLGGTGVLILTEIMLAKVCLNATLGRLTLQYQAAQAQIPDAHAILQHLRTQRAGLIETFAEFSFCHRTVLTALRGDYNGQLLLSEQF